LVTLADGSTVALNTATRVGIEYDTRERRVWLEGGEALFEVTPDARRPFVVNAGTGWARAIGTRFNVALDAESVTVVVLDGVVEVAPKTSEPRVSTRLSRGESAAFGPGGTLTDAAPERASPERVVAWREGKVRFDGWSLEQAIAEHNRYAHKAIRLDGSGPTNIRVSGAFRIGDTQAFLNALGELVPIQVVDTGESLSLTLPAPVATDSVQPAGLADMP
jgi:transmembrane sensor